MLATTPDRPSGPTSTQGSLALELYPRLDPPRPRSAPDDDAPVTATVLGLTGARDHRVRRDLETWAHRFTQAAVEVAGGDRPVSQLLRWTTAEVYQDLERRAQLVSHARLHGASGPAGGRRHPQVRPQVRSVRSCVVSPSVVEVSAHVRHGLRSRAVAARFERTHDRWTCTALEFA